MKKRDRGLDLLARIMLLFALRPDGND